MAMRQTNSRSKAINNAAKPIADSAAKYSIQRTIETSPLVSQAKSKKIFHMPQQAQLQALQKQRHIAVHKRPPGNETSSTCNAHSAGSHGGARFFSGTQLNDDEDEDLYESAGSESANEAVSRRNAQEALNFPTSKSLSQSKTKSNNMPSQASVSLIPRPLVRTKPLSDQPNSERATEHNHKLTRIQTKPRLNPSNLAANNHESNRQQEIANCDQSRVQLRVLRQNQANHRVLATENTTATMSTDTKVKHTPVLIRGKGQRASISSCSSSDSYVSYGSGYASGSGNSTDHENRHKADATIINDHNQPRQILADQPCSSETGKTVVELEATTECANKLNGGTTKCHDTSVSFETTNSAMKKVHYDDAEADDDDGDSQLKQHLSELEQLTDELASRNILGHLSDSTSKTIELTQESSDSISLGGSNTTPYQTVIIEPELSQLKSQTPQTATSLSLRSAVQSSNSSCANNDSRSTSTTPVSVIQSNSVAVQSSKSNSASRLACETDESAEIHHRRESETDQHPTKTDSTNLQRDCNSPVAASISQSQKQADSTKHRQEPFYHNLFQWEQLTSKGVTRPLLINDLDFTDLRDEDDCDLLNGGSTVTTIGGNLSRARNTINNENSITSVQQIAGQRIPQSKQSDDGETSALGSNGQGPHSSGCVMNAAHAPPPLPPPPISPFLGGLSVGIRPESQLMSSPSPISQNARFDSVEFGHEHVSAVTDLSRNSICIPQTSLTTRADDQTSAIAQLQQHGSNGLRSASSMSSLLFGSNGKLTTKRKKTMKLFWKEVREDRSLLAKLTKKRTIWDEIQPVHVDTCKLEHLFESKAKDLALSRSRGGFDPNGTQRRTKITVLDAKRSNAINIGMTKLPPMRTIKSAILKMDSSIMNREGIEKILTTMMPTEEEKSRIIEAQLANPDTPLGTAEQFLLNLASISALEPRLRLWAFQLDYSQIEKEVAEPLMDLKQAIEEIERSETFRVILGTLLSIGNFLNSTTAKGFQIDYLEKVPEVKDTVHKHSLLHHLCLFIQEKYEGPVAGDLYSEFSAVNRASKIDYSEVAKSLRKMQQDCKASWDHLKIVAKHDGLANMMSTSMPASNTPSVDNGQTNNPPTRGKLNNLGKLSLITTSGDSPVASEQHLTTKQLKTRVSDFLTDCAERIMVLMVIHRRVMNRFQKLLVYLGYPSHQIKQTQPNQVLKIINEFALEYRTKRERIRELLHRRQQCQHQGHHPQNRWRLGRPRWAGSQQCIDSLGYGNLNRPCSSSSSCMSIAGCSDSLCCSLTYGGSDFYSNRASEQYNPHANHGFTSENRICSPSGFSQMSNYSDYLSDQANYCSQFQSSTNASNSMSGPGVYDVARGKQDCESSGMNYNDYHQARERDEKLRRLLGAGKSLDGACNELYQMSHWSSTMTRITRHPPTPVMVDSNSRRCRAASVDMTTDMDARQSSYYKNLPHNGPNNCITDELEENSDEEILQSLVKTATAKSSHSNYKNPGRSLQHASRSKILSRLVSDRNPND